MTESKSRWPDLAAAPLLLITAGLVVWGSFAAFFVETARSASRPAEQSRVSLWGEQVLEGSRVVGDRGDTILIGISAVIAAILLVVASVLVLRATRDNNTWARSVTGLAAGWTAGITAFTGMLVLHRLDSVTNPDFEVGPGLGMWLHVAATVLALAVAIVLTLRSQAPRDHPWTERSPGPLALVTAAFFAIVASFLALYTVTRVRSGGNIQVTTTLWGQSVSGPARPSSSQVVQWGVPAMVAAGLLLLGAVLVGTNDQNPGQNPTRRGGLFSRLAASLGAGMLGGLVTALVVIVFDALSIEAEDRSHGRESIAHIGIGTYLLVIAVALAVFGATRGSSKPADPAEPVASEEEPNELR